MRREEGRMRARKEWGWYNDDSVRGEILGWGGRMEVCGEGKREKRNGKHERIFEGPE